jgi:threonine aldolase
VAAAGLIALEEGPRRLHEDHERARRLAEGLDELMPGSIDLEQVETNMVFLDTEAVGFPLFDTLERLAAHGVGATHSGGRIRMVTHLDVDDAGIGVALDAWRELAAERES